jgi:hypothetical protein
LPSFVALSLWPSFRWWMLPPLAALLAYRALQVPARAARHALPGTGTHGVELTLARRGFVATGVVEAKAAWKDLRAVSETADEVVLELDRSTVVVVPKAVLGPPERKRLRDATRHLPTGLFSVALLMGVALAAAPYLRLR